MEDRKVEFFSFFTETLTKWGFFYMIVQEWKVHESVMQEFDPMSTEDCEIYVVITQSRSEQDANLHAVSLTMNKKKIKAC